MKKILITGANFNNKGAQSMLFITVDEIKKRIPGAEVYFLTQEDLPEFRDLTFQAVYYAQSAVDLALGRAGETKTKMIVTLKNLAKKILGKKGQTKVRRIGELKKLMPEIDLILDISGFGLGSKWGVRGSEAYLDYLRLAEKYHIPIYLMPQSFGPFDFGAETAKMQREIKELLATAKVIFTREQDGYDLLTQDLRLTNVRKSSDIVLQNQGIKTENVYRISPRLEISEIKTEKNVAIIPNAQCFNHGDEKYNYHLYHQIIQALLKENYHVWILRHAGEDLPIGQKLKQDFRNEKNVQLIEKELSCLEYDELVKKFDFVVCSRFHGSVHAYRNAVPCVILGWAVKYQELAQSVKQEQFVFDVTKCENEEKILAAINEMIKSHRKQSQIIRENVKKIQKQNCFEILAESEK